MVAAVSPRCVSCFIFSGCCCRTHQSSLSGKDIPICEVGFLHFSLCVFFSAVVKLLFINLHLSVTPGTSFIYCISLSCPSFSPFPIIRLWAREEGARTACMCSLGWDSLCNVRQPPIIMTAHYPLCPHIKIYLSTRGHNLIPHLHNNYGSLYGPLWSHSGRSEYT